MKAKDDFDSSICEVSFLNNKVDGENDNVLFKSIILLLCAKLEKYVKDSCKEYIDLLIELKATNNLITSNFIKEIIQNEMNFINKVKLENYIAKQDYKNRSKIFAILWDNKQTIENLNHNEFVVSISNNGTTEFNLVYKKIGFPDIIDNLNDFVHNDLYSSTNYSIKETINKVIYIRHQIIHEDATPSLTSSDINLYIEIFKDFVVQINKILEDSINRIR